MEGDLTVSSSHSSSSSSSSSYSSSSSCSRFATSAGRSRLVSQTLEDLGLSPAASPRGTGGGGGAARDLPALSRLAESSRRATTPRVALITSSSATFLSPGVAQRPASSVRRDSTPEQARHQLSVPCGGHWRHLAQSIQTLRKPGELGPEIAPCRRQSWGGSHKMFKELSWLDLWQFTEMRENTASSVSINGWLRTGFPLHGFG